MSVAADGLSHKHKVMNKTSLKFTSFTALTADSGPLHIISFKM